MKYPNQTSVFARYKRESSRKKPATYLPILPTTALNHLIDATNYQKWQRNFQHTARPEKDFQNSENMERHHDWQTLNDLAQTSSSASSHSEQVKHLLARAGFGATFAELKELESNSIAEIVEELLTEPALPTPPGEWVTEPFDLQQYLKWTESEKQAYFVQNIERINDLRVWMLELMMSSAINLREKMTFFWHGHFTTDISSAELAQFLFKQNDTYRKHALGNFGDFLKNVYKDPGMLLYLNGAQNVVTAPNENFARELMELFTMGIGNYTEDDIKEAARAFTGWEIDPYNLTSFFNPNLHDYGVKSFLGERGNFDGDDIIDLILKQPQTATFICRKFYEFFISREVDEEYVQDLAAVFRANNYEIKPVLRSLFTSEHFYNANVRASLIKSPIELVVGNARKLSVEKADVYFLLTVAAILDQELLNPPNVAGWPGQRAWISPTTYVLRNTVSEIFVNENLVRDPVTNQPVIEFNPMKFARSFGIPTAPELANAIINYLVSRPLDEVTSEFLLQTLVGTAAPNDWSLDYPGADRLVTEFVIQILRLPEYHLT
ncbi:MAG: DUF1800 family protein [bacterium]